MYCEIVVIENEVEKEKFFDEIEDPEALVTVGEFILEQEYLNGNKTQKRYLVLGRIVSRVRPTTQHDFSKIKPKYTIQVEEIQNN